MIIATFGPTTEWVGKTITREGDVFMLEGHGPITAADVMEYDRQGHLAWVNAGTRAWVGSRALTPATKPAVTLEEVSAKHLRAAEQQFAEGRHKKALASIFHEHLRVRP